MVFRRGSTRREGGRPRRAQVPRTLRYLRDYAERLRADGLDAVRPHLRPVLVGAGMKGQLEDTPKRRRRTHAMEPHGPGEHIAVQSLLDRVWPLRPSEHALDDRFISVGHAHDADVVIPDYSLSSLHAAFTIARPMAITDLRSLNGTHVNDEPVAPRTFTTLHDGDRVRLGRLVMRYHDGRGFLDALRTMAARLS
ncbi:MAG: FHA domain-containing protein [Myxococcota bacterium]